ncbi:MAG: NRDE family protein [Rhodospirillales bacterium]
MCTLVILRRPGHDWPLIIAANRDEMATRPWRRPGRHWEDRVEVVAGQDETAGGTWLGLNDWGVIAGVLNRPGSLGPDPALRSRGELPLEALDHAEAIEAAKALSALDATSYRTFNLVIADAIGAYWLSSDGESVRSAPIPEGISMITAHDLNDTRSPRIARFLPLFEAAATPDPENSDWAAWQTLMGSGGEDAMSFKTDSGFATVSSSLLALADPLKPGVKPVWLFAPGAPDQTAYDGVEL